MLEILTLTLCQQPGMGSPSRPCKVKTEVKKSLKMSSDACFPASEEFAHC